MTSNTAPSPNFTGINFNTDFFPSALGDFVEYPIAQGPTTIATLYSSVIDTLSSSTSFNLLNSLTANLNIAVNGGAGQTIRIGATSGASVHCANVDFQNHSINNSTNASGGNISICNSMTSGTLNLGTNTARSGTINVGNGAGATGTIDIGSSNTIATLNGNVRATTKLNTPILDCITDAGAGSTSLSIGPSAVNGNIVIGAALGIGDVSIGGAQSAGGTITLGSSSTVTTNAGTLTSTGLITANGGLTIGGSNGITLTSSGYTPTAGQLGYVVTGTSIASPVFPVSGNTTSFMSVALTTGTWLVFASRQFTAGTATTAVFFGLGKTQRSSNGIASTDSEYGISSPPLSTIPTYGHVSGVVSLTAPTTIYLNINTTYTGTAPTTGTTYALMNATRIG